MHQDPAYMYIDWMMRYLLRIRGKIGFSGLMEQVPVLLYKVNTLTCRNRSRKDRDDLSIDLLLSN